MSDATYKKTLQQRNMIMLAPTGSELLGLKKPEKSDTDEMGICLETQQQLVGFAPFEQDVYRTAVERTGNYAAKSESGDIDLVVYGLRKFVRLALGGNPNLVGMLFVPESFSKIYSPVASELQKLSGKFISKQTGKAFLGYMKAQRERLTGERGQKNVNRNELVERFGYDTKYAMHLLRLGMQGCELFRHGKLTFPLVKESVAYLTQIRDGELTLQKVTKDATVYEQELEDLMDVNPRNIPEAPDYAGVEEWLMHVYRRSWYEDQKASQ